MANLAHGKYGKDRPENFIEGALRGGQGKSDDIFDKSIGDGQTIKTAVALDNVKLALDIETSIKDTGGFGGSITNLDHSLTGASAVSDKLGTA